MKEKNQNDFGNCYGCSTPLEAYAWRLRCQTPGCYTAAEGGMVDDLQGLAASATESDAAFEQAVAVIVAQFEVERALRADFKAAVIAATEQRLADRDAELEAVRADNLRLKTEGVEKDEHIARLRRRLIDAEQTARDLQPAPAAVVV